MVTKGKPFVWRWIKKKFPDTDPEKIVIAFGKKIYSEHPITPDLHVHEMVHLRRQKYSVLYALWWWRKYLTNVKFRAEEEALAYRTQYQFLKKNIKDKNALSRAAANMSATLSGPIYGSILTKSQARKIIEG